MNFRDMNFWHRARVIGWLIFFGLVTWSLTQVIHREMDGLPAAGAVALAISLMIALTGALWLIHAAQARGYVSGRGAMLGGGLLVFVIVWFIVFLMNTSNAFYWLTSRDALRSDVRNLHHAFELLEKGTTDHFANASESLKARANSAARAVTAEINNKLNPGYSEEAKARMGEFELVVSENIKLTSLPKGGRGSPEALRDFTKMTQESMDGATKNAVERLDLLKSKAERHSNDEVVRDTREKLDYLLANITNLQASTVLPTMGKVGANLSSSSSLTAFLEKAFVLYSEREKSVMGLMSNSLLAGIAPPNFPKLDATPYSSDLKTVGRIYEPQYWSKSMEMPKFWLAVAMGLFADLLLAGWLFFFVLRED